MPLTAAHLRKMADELEAEEAEAQRDLDNATTQAERTALQEKVDRLEQELEALKRPGGEPTGGAATPPDSSSDDDEDEDDDDDPKPKRKTRPGRKRGQVYQDAPGEAGYVYQGDDEPDEVELEDEPS